MQCPYYYYFGTESPYMPHSSPCCFFCERPQQPPNKYIQGQVSIYLSIPFLHNKNMKTTRERSVADADGGVGKKQHYKLWVLAAIVLVAVWFMFTGSLTLTWSAGSDDDFDSTILDDLDVLEVEDREKVVRHMWDVYTHTHTRTNTVRLPQFWSEAFQAAYEHLASDVPAVRDAAVSEIAKMSLKQLPLQLQLQPHVQSVRGSRKIKPAESNVDSAS